MHTSVRRRSSRLIRWAGIVRYDFKSPFAKPEKLFDVEMGTGYRTENFRFSVNMFWMEFTDELVKSGAVDIFGQPVTGNAERTRHIGIELDGSSTLTANISLSGNATYFEESPCEILGHR